MKKPFVKKLDDPVYCRTVYLGVGPRPVIAKKLEKLLDMGDGELERNQNSVGCVYYLPRGTFAIWLKQYTGSIDDIDVLVHEVMHLVHGCLDLIGMKLHDHSEEAYAYYAGFWTKQILETIKKHK